jgi:DNA processing protein
MKATPGSEELRAWLQLLRTPGVGSRTFVRLLEACGSAGEVIRLPRRDLEALGLKGPSLDFLGARDWHRVDQDLLWLEQPGNHLVSLQEPNYPGLLREVCDPPPLLFVHGHPEVLSNPQLAIVGTRNPSPSGRETAREFARYLAGAGLTVTSGLALGIDGSAHQGALEAGLTIAVTGTGLDRVYPSRNRDLAHRIAEQGALVSEFPPGTPPAPENFPRRNRIISGLSLGTLVAEAALRSGSLITARLAGEQGREIFAIPGSIHNPMARGCHSLIRQGAKLVETAADILEELGPLLGGLASMAQPSLPGHQSAGRLLDAEYQELLEQMGFDPVPIDVLIQRTGLTADAVSSMLLLLELEGQVTSLSGGRYSRIVKA